MAANSLTNDAYIDNIVCLLNKNGVDISTVIRKNAVEDSSPLGFHMTTRYEVTTWDSSSKDIYRKGKNNNMYNTHKKVVCNKPIEKVIFTSKLKYSLYLLELLKDVTKENAT